MFAALLLALALASPAQVTLTATVTTDPSPPVAGLVVHRVSDRTGTTILETRTTDADGRAVFAVAAAPGDRLYFRIDAWSDAPGVLPVFRPVVQPGSRLRVARWIAP